MMGHMVPGKPNKEKPEPEKPIELKKFRTVPVEQLPTPKMPPGCGYHSVRGDKLVFIPGDKTSETKKKI